jgi:hypothetical protein
MKVIVTGGRGYSLTKFARETLDEFHHKHVIEILAQGGATGADKIAADWADWRGIFGVTFHAPWRGTHGQFAGFARNKVMLDTLKPNFVIAFPGGKGTGNMIELAERANVEVLRI